MNDLRGNHRTENISSSSSSRIFGIIFTLAVFATMGGVYFFSTAHAPSAAAATHHVEP